MKNEKSVGKYLNSFLHHKIFPLIILYIVMIIIFTVWAAIVGASFFKLSTARNILQSLVISSFLTIGSGCLLMAGHLDLSQASIGALGGIILALMVETYGLPWPIAMIICFICCAALGACNAFMITKFRFPSFIATLAMASVAKGLMYIVSSLGSDTGRSASIYFSNAGLDYLGNGSIAGIPVSVIVMIIFFIVYGIIMSRSRFGTKVMMMGGNPTAANLAGINATGILFILFMNSGVMGGVSGLFFTARLQQGNLMALATNQFTGVTAAVLGGISFGGGAGGMGGAFMGLLILQTFQIGMGIVGLNPDWVNVFSGVLLLIALAFDFFTRQRSRKAPTL